jgi:hypothetical protein
MSSSHDALLGCGGGFDKQGLIFEVEKGFWESRPLPHRKIFHACPFCNVVLFHQCLPRNFLCNPSYRSLLHSPNFRQTSYHNFLHYNKMVIFSLILQLSTQRALSKAMQHLKKEGAPIP